jgi:hypothetical protein
MINPFSWVREALGIRRDWKEMKRRQDEERGRSNLVRRVTDEEIEKYDPHVRKLKAKAHKTEVELPKFQPIGCGPGVVALCIVLYLILRSCA